ncbi:hypothetical protein F7725_018254, partial [Dissostichus mawsoni]
MEGRRVATNRGKEWKKLSKEELMAFIGLTILAGSITNARRHFLTELSKELVTPHMKSRLEGTPNLPTYITEAMGRCGVTKAANQQQERSTEGQQKRKRCQMCPRNKDRKATNCSWKCSTPVCNGHSQKQIVCDNCTQLLEKHGSDPSKDVSQKMRELSRFVLAVKSINNNINRLQDVLVPPNFNLAVQAAQKASGFTKLKYRTLIKGSMCIVVGQHVKAEDEAAAARVKSFLGLIDAEWDHFVSRSARTNLEESRWNKKDMIPLTEDVMKLNI